MLDKHKRFEAMVHGLSSSLYRYAYWLCRDRTTAEDLVQETFMRAWRYLDGLRDEKKAKSWLMTTVRREYARQLGRNRLVTAELEPDTTPGSQDVSEADPERSTCAQPCRPSPRSTANRSCCRCWAATVAPRLPRCWTCSRPRS